MALGPAASWADLPALLDAVRSAHSHSNHDTSDISRPPAWGGRHTSAPAFLPGNQRVVEPLAALPTSSRLDRGQDEILGSRLVDDMPEWLVDDEDVARALAEPVVDDLRTLTGAPDAVISLSLKLGSVHAALEATEMLPLCGRLCMLRLRGAAFGASADLATSSSACETLASAPASVTALDLSSIAPHRRAVPMVVGKLAEAAPRLRHLCLSRSDVLGLEAHGGLSASVLRRATRLARLELACVRLQDPTALVPVAAAIATLTSLRTLDLSGNLLERAAAGIIADALEGVEPSPLALLGSAGGLRSASCPASVTSPTADSPALLGSPMSPPPPVAADDLASSRSASDPGSDTAPAAAALGSPLPTAPASPPPPVSPSPPPPPALRCLEGPAASLRCVALSGVCPTDPGGTLRLVSALSRSSTLAVLALNGNDFGGGTGPPSRALGATIVSAGRRLRALDLSGCRLWTAGCDDVAHALAAAPCLVALSLAGNDMAGQGTAAASALAAALGACTALTDIELSGNCLCDDAMTALGPALSALPSLRHLGLEQNRLRAGSLASLGPPPPAAPSPWFPALLSLRLGANAMRSPGMAELAAWLPGVASLQHLGLHTCRLHPADVEALAAALPWAERPPAQAEPAAAEAEVAAAAAAPHPSASCLRHIDLHDNLLPGAAGGAALRTLLASGGCDVLASLSVRQCELDDESVSVLAASLGGLAWKVRRLRLDLGGNPAVTVLPRGLGCLGELVVDSATVRSPEMRAGEDGVKALRRASAESESESDADSDAGSDGASTGSSNGLSQPRSGRQGSGLSSVQSWQGSALEDALRDSAAPPPGMAARLRPEPVHEGPDVEEDVELEDGALDGLMFGADSDED